MCDGLNGIYYSNELMDIIFGPIEQKRERIRTAITA
jgi:hypothetical protein